MAHPSLCRRRTPAILRRCCIFRQRTVSSDSACCVHQHTVAMSVGRQPAIRRRWLDVLCTNSPVHRSHTCSRTGYGHHSAIRSPLSSCPTYPAALPLILSLTRPFSSFTSATSSATPPQSVDPIDSLDDVLGESHINWYPGHMHKTFKALDTQLKHCNVVVEVRDARVSRTHKHYDTQYRHSSHSTHAAESNPH